MSAGVSVSWNETKGDADADHMDQSASMNDTSQHILGQGERIKRFGIECLGPQGDGILFRAGTWKPGGEYVQKLVVRNVSTSVKKLKYKLPTTRYFSLAYPEVVVLSPGMSAELDIIFRPVENDPYDDTVFITVLGGAGGFHVSVRATIDKLILSSPPGVDLGFCPTHQTTSKIFRLSNEGEIDAPFRWEQPKGFKLEPSSGVVAAGTKLDICVSVVPTDASVLVGQAVCTVGDPGVHALIDEPILLTRLSAIGKYAYISLSEKDLNFGEVLTGTPPESIRKEIVLRNESVVPAEFSLVRHEADADSVFDLSPQSGVIPPQSEQAIIVRYHALGAGSYSLDRYTFITPGDCRTSIALAGTCMPCKVSLAKEPALTSGALGPDGSVTFAEAAPGNSLNFRDVEVGKAETRILQLRNHSLRDVHFTILTGADGMFKISPMRGVIRAEGPPFNVSVSFLPGYPINYYKRYWVLLGDALPLFFDALGSGYIRAKGDIKEQRPAPLRHAHIQAYRNRSVQGMGGMSPDELDAAHTSGTADPSFFGQVGTVGTRAMSLTTLSNPLTRSGETSRVDIATAHEFFIEDSDLTCREINCNASSFDFGFIPYKSTSDSKTATISNNTNGKVTCMWRVPHTVNDLGEYEQAAFDVSPAQADINPGQSASFKVTFKPHQTDRNYVGELEALVFFKNQRTFRLVNDATLTPPWCLSFNVTGHTFASGQLLATARLTGGNVRAGKLPFPSCFEGETLYQSVILHNTSNLPSTFRFEMGFGDGDRGADADVFSVRPSVGEVAAESFAVVYVRFSPSKSRKYTQLLRCIVNGEPSAKLLLEGSASVPFLLCPDVTSDDPTMRLARGRLTGSDNFSKVREYLDIPGIVPSPHAVPNGPLGSFYLKPTCVGLSTSRQFTLKNHSRLPLRYRVILPPEAEGVLSISPLKGLLRGNQITKLLVSFAPRACHKYTLKIKIVTYPIGGRAQRVIDSRQPMGTTAPEILQTLSFFVVAPGEIGAVQFDPPRLDMDVRLVFTTQKQDFFLENVSDSDLSYRLVFREEYVKDTGATHSSASVKDHVLVSDTKPMRTPENGSDDSITCDLPHGVLQARSRLRTPLTFQPTKAGTFDFIICCEVQISDGSSSSSSTLMLPNEEVALLRVSQKDRESNMQGLGADALAGLPLIACVSTRATFPKINIADVRVEKSALVTNVEHLWRNFSLRALNTDLSKPLTAAECKLNSSSSPDITKMKKYKFEFTPAVVGAPQQSVTFLFRNNGHLTTNFHLHLPNEKQLELEQWCDEDEPSEEMNKIISMIEELKLFTIEPQHGVLEPGQSTNVTITYSHAHLKFGGVHNLPVHVKLDKGKQFFLELCGRTLPNPGNGAGAGAIAPTPTPLGSRSLTASAREKKPLPLTNKDALPPTDIMLTACTGSASIYELIPVPVGLDPSETPLQRMQLINVSGCKALYDLDMASIDALSDANFGQPILRCANPTGVVEPRSSVFLELYFFPLEAKTYTIPIKIVYEKYVDGDAPAAAMGDGLAQGSVYSLQSDTSAASASQGGGGGGGGAAAGALALPVPPRGGGAKGSAGNKRRKSNASPEVLLSLVGRGFDPRDKIVLENRIMDRPRDTLKPGATIFGEYPPAEQLIIFNKQLATLSSDLLTLDFMPQGSKCSRLVVLRNLQVRESVEFSIDAEASRLVQEGLLSIYPSSGKLDPGEFALIDFNFSLDTRSCALADAVTINVMEIISKNAKARRGGVPAKLLDRVLKKNPHAEHESVVKRITFARNIQLEANVDHIPDGRTASMPSTVAVNGQVQAGVTHGQGLDSSLVESTRSKVGFDASFAGGSAMLDTGTVEMSASRTSKTGDSKQTSRSSNNSKIGGSGLMSRNRTKTEDRKTLHGSVNSFILRITGFVLPYETSYRLFKQMGGSGVMKGLVDRDAAPPIYDEAKENVLGKPGCMTDFFVPPTAKFIPCITAATFTNGDASNEPPAKSKLANALSKIDGPKEFEVRDISQLVMHDLFRSLLDAASVREYAENVVSETAARTVTVDNINGASVVNTSTLKLVGAVDQTVPAFEGGPLYGVFIDELRHELDIGGAKATPIPTSRDADDAQIQKKDPLAKAVQQPGFVELAAEILRNTMYNLMQEAAFEEFPVTEEPLAFAIKDRKRGA